MLGKTHFQNQNLVLKMGFFVNLYRIEVGKMKGNNEKKVIGHLARQDLNSVRLKKFCGILTIILSTALIIVVTLYFVQTQRFSIQDAEGRYQATFMDVNSKVVNKMKAMKNVEMGETRTLGTLNQGTYKITIRTMTESLLKLDQVGFRVNSILYKYEKRIEESNIELEANKQLMTSLSHDVRTPMTTLIGYLDALDLKLVSSDKEEQYLRLAKEKAYDLKKYIEVLFEWFRINSDEEQLEIKAVDITEETRRIFLDWIPIIEEHRIGYNIEIPEKAIIVEIDEDCYMRAINNIVQNIFTHSKAANISITASEGNGKFRLEIGDDGIGIAKEDLNYIFERLYRCNKGRSGKGNGLGLNISKLLLEKMGGTISAFSEPGKGTVFCIEFSVIQR